jgi:HAD superfamily hydrolase (TIGR01509 family)
MTSRADTSSRDSAATDDPPWPPVAAILFDLDGLLTDTEPCHFRAYQAALASFGVDVGWDEYSRHWIREGKGIAEFADRHRLALDLAEVRRRKAVHYRRLVARDARLMPGAWDLLVRLRGRRRLALVTSSYLEDARCVLDTLRLTPFFEVIVGKTGTIRVKPAPDLFLAAAAQLQVAPRACLVLEDAEKGVRAAVAAGMRAIAVPSEYTRHNDFGLASRVVTCLDEVTLDLIDGT